MHAKISDIASSHTTLAALNVSASLLQLLLPDATFTCELSGGSLHLQSSIHMDLENSSICICDIHFLVGPSTSLLGTCIVLLSMLTVTAKSMFLHNRYYVAF